MQPPGSLISIAERLGLIVDIGAWVLRRVAAFAVQVNRRRPDPLEFAINVSQPQFLRTVLEETGADPSWLMLELTESMLADNSAAMIGIFREIRGMGVGLSSDDFGTEYSSLSHLAAFSISEIKIDRSFVSYVDANRSKHVIVDAMIRPSKKLQISVIAEGAETEGEISILQKFGCSYAQGYFFARPMPEAKFETFVNPKASSDGRNDVVPQAASVGVQDFSWNAVLVEDDPLVREVLGETLDQLGWKVTTASSAEEALALPASFPAPGILITDINLGAGMTELEFYPVARRRWPNVGIIVISGRPPPHAKLKEMGSNDIFLAKPVLISALEAAIASVIKPDRLC